MATDYERRLAALEQARQAETARPQVVIYDNGLDDDGLTAVMREHFQQTPARLAVFLPHNGRDSLPVAIPARQASERPATGMETPTD